MNNRLVVYSSKLHRGGAEKHLVLLLNELVDLGWEIHLVVSQGGGSYEKILRPDIRMYLPSTNGGSYSASLFRGGLRLLRVVNTVRPRLLFSIQDGPNIVSQLVSAVLSMGKIRNVIEVQNNPQRELRSFVQRLYFLIAKKLYPRCSLFISLSEGVMKAYLQAIPALNSVANCVIHNIGQVRDRPFSRTAPPARCWKILAVGRLTRQKDYPTLLESISILRQRLLSARTGYDINLTILGDGEQLDELQELVATKGLTERVVFSGFTNDVEEFYKASDIFVMSSRWEGFGNVLTEAMSYGLPVIATDCEFGPAEIIRENRVQGILVPVGQPGVIANSIFEVIHDPELYARLALEGYRRSLAFGSKKIAAEYHNVFQKVGDGEK